MPVCRVLRVCVCVCAERRLVADGHVFSLTVCGLTRIYSRPVPVPVLFLLVLGFGRFASSARARARVCVITERWEGCKFGPPHEIFGSGEGRMEWCRTFDTSTCTLFCFNRPKDV